MTQTVSVKLPDSLAHRFERCVRDSGESKSSALRSQIRDYCNSVEDGTPEQLRQLLEEKKEKKESIQEEQQRLSEKVGNLDDEIQQLQSQLERLESQDIEELRSELVTDVQRDADLREIAKATDKVEKYRRVVGLDSVEEVIKEIHDYADSQSAGDGL